MGGKKKQFTNEEIIEKIKKSLAMISANSRLCLQENWISVSGRDLLKEIEGKVKEIIVYLKQIKAGEENE